MVGIKMSDCKFYVDEEARTVVCVIPKTSDMLVSFIIENFSFSDFDVDLALRYPFAQKLEMPRSFMGKAVCAEGDEWNVETGKLLAFSRAKDKCYKSFYKRANLVVQCIDKRLGQMIDAFNTLGMKLEENRTSLNKRLEELMPQ